MVRARSGLKRWVEVGECCGAVRSLNTEVPLNPNTEVSDQFLQTRTISLAEARRELSLWKDPAIDEITSLETTNRAVDRVKVGLVEQWIEQGFTVIQLPGKAVLTRVERVSVVVGQFAVETTYHPKSSDFLETMSMRQGRKPLRYGSPCHLHRCTQIGQELR